MIGSGEKVESGLSGISVQKTRGYPAAFERYMISGFRGKVEVSDGITGWTGSVHASGTSGYPVKTAPVIGKVEPA
jgi:hypothetical protein